MLYRRGRIWWFKFRFCGRLIQESSKETNRNRAAEAERRYRNRLSDSYNAVPERKAPVSFSVATERFIANKVASGKLPPKGVKRERGTLNHLLPVFGTKLLTDISADDINQYIYARLAEAAPKTAE